MSRPASLKRAQAPGSTGGESRSSGRDAPTPTEIRAARERAGLTQADAAELAGYGAQSRWAEVESGTVAMPAWRWEYFLHRAGLKKMPFERAPAKEF